MNSMELLVVISEMFGQNTFIASLPGRDDCIVVDPGLQPDDIVAAMAEHKLNPAMILVTHGHADHIGGLPALKQIWPHCPVVIGEGDAGKLTDAVANLSANYGMPLICAPADRLVAQGDIVEAAGLEFEVREAPGHSAGHVVFVCRQTDPITVFGGDVLFQGSVGRVDFPDGNFEELELSITNQLFTLPDETVVLPGHGPATTVGQERQFNPFVGQNRLA